MTQEVYLEAASGADSPLGIGQPHRQTQAQQIRHALFQVVAGHGQVAQVQVGVGLSEVVTESMLPVRAKPRSPCNG